MKKSSLYSCITLMLVCSISYVHASDYVWLTDYDTTESINSRIQPPKGYKRISVTEDSFAHWLRHLPLKPKSSAVFLHDKKLKLNQTAHFAVVDIDTGKRDLQQCADAVMRLRAEYLFSKEKYDQIQFNFTSGDTAYYSKWIDGYRLTINGNKVAWHKSQSEQNSYQSFKKYLNSVFTYAGSYSLSKELKPVKNINDITIGDVFIKGGFPGHAVIVVDVAIHDNTKEKVFLLAQSYMPAQDVHILNNFTNSKLNPWYSAEIIDKLETPEWTFSKEQLMRFKVK